MNKFDNSTTDNNFCHTNVPAIAISVTDFWRSSSISKVILARLQLMELVLKVQSPSGSPHLGPTC